MRVRQGDCVNSLAYDSGLRPETVWEAGENASLREQRERMSILMPGDELELPEVRVKQETRGTEETHRFRRLYTRVVLRIRVRRNTEPLADTAYTLTIGDEIIEGRTDGEGWLEERIPTTAKSGRLVVERVPKEFALEIGSLDPIEEVSGVQGRLRNLGFDPGPIDNIFGPLTSRALADFQQARGLEPTGARDEDTINELRDEYGC